jgi:23S rRNA (cytosine1962-C5)-methyltransferase
MKPSLVIKAGREKSILRHHPWVFSGAVADVLGDPAPGETVELLSAGGNFLARAAYSPQSQIRARIWTWDESEPVDEGFFRGRLEAAFALRAGIPSLKETTALRLVHAESDGLPGLIVDRYGEWLVLQALAWSIEPWLEMITTLLMDMLPASGIYERSEADVRKLEGLPERRGSLGNGEPPENIEIEENGLHFYVDILHGHKTGFYLDQRSNRVRVRQLAAGRDTLDCFCYTGGFLVSALAGGAQSVTAVEASAEALGMARRNAALNGFCEERVNFQEGDVFNELRRFRDMGRSFDLVVLDPPKFAASAAQVDKAARCYKDINLLALKLLRPVGILVTFSCSGAIDPDLFQRILAAAALDAGAAGAQIIDRLQQGADHPVSLAFPEGAYLKGLVVVKK